MDLIEGMGVRVNEWNTCFVGGTSQAKTILDVGLSLDKVEERGIGLGQACGPKNKTSNTRQGIWFFFFFPPVGNGERCEGFWR